MSQLRKLVRPSAWFDQLTPQLDQTQKKQILAIGVAALFHFSGLIGLYSPLSDWFLALTPLNLLVAAGLLWWTEPMEQRTLWVVTALGFFLGFFSEVIGVNTGLLFGDYAYGPYMGWKLWEVPLMIGIQWFVTVFSIAHLVEWGSKKSVQFSSTLGQSVLAKAILAAALTTGFDYILEPGAIRLGFWAWGGDGSIPIYNYVCWFLVSLLIHLYYFKSYAPGARTNYYAIGLIVIQSIFFLAIG